jgi:Zn-dependent protease with chaperone function
VTVGIALAMFFAPFRLVVVDLRSAKDDLVAIVLGWVPAFMAIVGLLRARRPFVPPRGRRLTKEEAPDLFAMLAELGAAACTAPPAVVFLTERVELAVTETRLSRDAATERVLFVGAPALACLSVAELRAGIAHELGHFAFGDTRLLGLVSYAHAVFRAVLENTRRRAPDINIGALHLAFAFARVIGDGVVANYARLFFWLTRFGDRRAELAADQLAGRIAGPLATMSLLEKMARAEPLYNEYLRCDVARAVDAGALPADLVEGFARFTTRMRELGASERIERAVRERETDPLDAHPALSVRTAKLLAGASARGAIAGADTGDERTASSVVQLDIHAFLLDCLSRAAAPALRGNRSLTRVAWDAIPSKAFAPEIALRARALTAELFPLHTDARSACAMLVAILDDLEADRLQRLALTLAPLLPHTPPELRLPLIHAAIADALTVLFQGALVERGAELEPSLGEPCVVFRYEGERVHAAEMAHAAPNDPELVAELTHWAKRLSWPI